MYPLDYVTSSVRLDVNTNQQEKGMLKNGKQKDNSLNPYNPDWNKYILKRHYDIELDIDMPEERPHTQSVTGKLPARGDTPPLVAKKRKYRIRKILKSPRLPSPNGEPHISTEIGDPSALPQSQKGKTAYANGFFGRKQPQTPNLTSAPNLNHNSSQGRLPTDDSYCLGAKSLMKPSTSNAGAKRNLGTPTALAPLNHRKLQNYTSRLDRDFELVTSNGFEENFLGRPVKIYDTHALTSLPFAALQTVLNDNFPLNPFNGQMSDFELQTLQKPLVDADLDILYKS